MEQFEEIIDKEKELIKELAAKEPKIESKHLSNEQTEKVEWELIHIDIHPQDKRCGIVDVRLAYVDDIRDIYTIRNSGNIHLGKVYPNFIKRQILSRIKEVIGDKKVVKKTTHIKITPTKITINKAKIITIKRNK